MIREVQEHDFLGIDQLIISAFSSSQFEYHDEAELVKSIRKEPSYSSYFEVIAEKEGKIIGHGLLSECYIGKTVCQALAPLSVSPSHQKKGIGQEIIRALEDRSEKHDFPGIIILGDPDYYGRFGYQKAVDYQIKAPFEVPESHFLVKELKENGLANTKGTVRYLEAFN